MTWLFAVSTTRTDFQVVIHLDLAAECLDVYVRHSYTTTLEIFDSIICILASMLRSFIFATSSSVCVFRSWVRVVSWRVRSSTSSVRVVWRSAFSSVLVSERFVSRVSILVGGTTHRSFTIVGTIITIAIQIIHSGRCTRQTLRCTLPRSPGPWWCTPPRIFGFRLGGGTEPCKVPRFHRNPPTATARVRREC
jgi:hypothetical protein